MASQVFDVVVEIDEHSINAAQTVMDTIAKMLPSISSNSRIVSVYRRPGT